MAEEKIYPYAVARIRVLEKNLFTKQGLSNLADAKDVSECLRIMAENGYEGALDVEAHNFEEVLSSNLAKTYAVIQELAPSENFVEVFLYKNDYHNLKVLMKEEVMRTTGSPFLLKGGTVSTEKMLTALEDRNYVELPPIMGEAIIEAFDIYSKTQNGQMIDIVLDKACFRQMYETARAADNEFVLGYVQRVCDLTNLKSFFRIRNMNKDFLTFTNAFVPGGRISNHSFYNAFGMDTPYNEFKSTDYGTICEEGMTKGFTVFEKLCDDFIMNYVKSAKYIALTLEPMVAFLYAKEAEVKTLRIILTSKLNKIDSATIKERVRESYV